MLEYCATLGDVYDVVVENMERQAQGLQGMNKTPGSGRGVFHIMRKRRFLI